MRLTDYIQDVGGPIAFYPGLKKITGSVTATLFLCQLIYWQGKQKDSDGWIYKTSEDFEEETGLTYKEQSLARKKLIGLGFIEEEYKRLDHVMRFKLNIDAINEAWEGVTRNSRTDLWSVRETTKGKLGNRPLGRSLNSNTENTTETTNIDIDDDEENPQIENSGKSGKSKTPNIYRTYENEIGLLTPMIADALKDAEQHYPPDWITAALQQAARNNARSWSYAEAILKRWKVDGFQSDNRKKKPKQSGGMSELDQILAAEGLLD